MKKIIGLFIFTIVGILGIGNVNAANDTPTDTNMSSNIENAIISGRGALKGSNVQGVTVTVGKDIPMDYNFTLGTNKNDKALVASFSGNCYAADSTEVGNVKEGWNNKYNYDKWTGVGMHRGKCYAILQDSNGNPVNYRNKYTGYYKKVDTYNGKFVDVKLTLVDYEYQEETGVIPTLDFEKDDIGINVIGVKWAKVKYEFFDSSTGQKISVKGNTSYWDVDFSQGIVIHNNNKGIYISSENKLSINKVGGVPYIFDGAIVNDVVLNAAAGSYESEASFTEIFEGNELTRTFKFGSTKFEKPFWRNENGEGLSDAEKALDTWFSPSGTIYNEAVTAVVGRLPKPEKSVNKDVVNIGEEFIYTVSQEVFPTVDSKKYTLFKIEDTLENCLTVDKNKIKILDARDNDVTSKFNIEVSGQKITITPKSLADDSFYGNTYNVLITTSIKSGYDLSSYKQGDKYVIPNFATVTVNGNSDEVGAQNATIAQNTEVVTVEYTPEVVYNVPKTSSYISMYITLIGVVTALCGVAMYVFINRKKTA